jgi:predicted Zn finger-like uncharacterized protein
MILTCPACSTNYVVKDGAIPRQGRQVRCAACKHSWHQDAMAGEEAVAPPAHRPAEEPPAPPSEPVQAAEQHDIEAHVDHAPWDHDHDAAMTSSHDDVAAPAPEPSAWGDPAANPLPESFDATAPIAHDDAPPVVARGESDAPLHSFAEPDADPAMADPAAVVPEHEPELAGPADDDFEPYAPIGEDDEPPRRRWPWVALLLLLIVGGAAAFWFLAPPSWKVRAGIAGAAASALEIKVDSTDRTPLAQSDKDLVTVSGRIINNSDQDQSLPPIHVLLSDKATKQVVHRWTIAPPVATLPPRQATNFNSAEIGVPKTGDDLTVKLGP